MPAPRADIAEGSDADYRKAVAEGRTLQGACALNGALACLKLGEWDRAVDLATLALELEQSREKADTDTAADQVRTSRAWAYICICVCVFMCVVHVYIYSRCAQEKRSSAAPRRRCSAES